MTRGLAQKTQLSELTSGGSVVDAPQFLQETMLAICVPPVPCWVARKSW